MSCPKSIPQAILDLRCRIEKLSKTSPGAPADALGVECEYAVYENGRQIHFGDLIHKLAEAFPGAASHETENRFRLAGGHLLYSDGWYAELATPPEPLLPDAPSRLAVSV